MLGSLLRHCEGGRWRIIPSSKGVIILACWPFTRLMLNLGVCTCTKKVLLERANYSQLAKPISSRNDLLFKYHFFIILLSPSLGFSAPWLSKFRGRVEGETFWRIVSDRWRQRHQWTDPTFWVWRSNRIKVWNWTTITMDAILGQQNRIQIWT